MSKILNIRNSLKRIKHYLFMHDFTCILFNNDSKIYSTLKTSDDFSTSHDEILKKIYSIRCSSITDFSKIETSINKLETLVNYDSSKVISVIVSDGYHTIDNDKTVEEIKNIFFKKFNYSIGIGNEFDSNLLSSMSEHFIIQNNSHLFDFLFNLNMITRIKIPKSTFFVSNKKYTIVEDQTMEEDKCHYRKTEKSEKNIKQTFMNQVMEDSNHVKKHFVFIIDISGSMDESIYDCLLTNDREDFIFYYDEFENDTLISCSEDDFQIFLENDSNHHVEIYKNYNLNYNPIDEVLYTCKSLYNVQKDDANRLEKLFKMNHNLYRNEKLKRFVNHKYNSLLTFAEKKMNTLLHETITITYMDSNIIPIHEVSNENICSICMTQTRNILFSCHHVACCFDCVLKLLEPLDPPSCPICRQNITWLRHIIYPNTNRLSCIQCNVNLSDIYQNPCNHILYCTKCCNVDDYKFCSICNKKIDVLTKIYFS